MASDAVYLKELEWLVHFYLQRGFTDKAQEILGALKRHSHDSDNVVDMFEADEERRA
jgi:hypothetical protein